MIVIMMLVMMVTILCLGVRIRTADVFPMNPHVVHGVVARCEGLAAQAEQRRPL